MGLPSYVTVSHAYFRSDMTCEGALISRQPGIPLDERQLLDIKDNSIIT